MNISIKKNTTILCWSLPLSSLIFVYYPLGFFHDEGQAIYNLQAP